MGVCIWTESWEKKEKREREEKEKRREREEFKKGYLRIYRFKTRSIEENSTKYVVPASCLACNLNASSACSRVTSIDTPGVMAVLQLLKSVGRGPLNVTMLLSFIMRALASQPLFTLVVSFQSRPESINQPFSVDKI